MRATLPGSDSAPLILVVDDEPQIRALLKTVLEREGYRVCVRPDGRSALEALASQDVSLLITDIRMPRMDGLELLEAARGVRPDLGSIVITGFASTEAAVDALRRGRTTSSPSPSPSTT